jgi:hypothetical protein
MRLGQRGVRVFTDEAAAERVATRCLKEARGNLARRLRALRPSFKILASSRDARRPRMESRHPHPQGHDRGKLKAYLTRDFDDCFVVHNSRS